jgi:hypothetical protein
MSTKETRRLRIRHCAGNRQAWMLVALNADGSESDAFGSYATAMSLDGLLRSADAQYLLTSPHTIEMISSTGTKQVYGYG